VTVDPRERQLLAQLLGMAVVRLDVDRALEQKRFVETVQLLWMALAARSAVAISSCQRPCELSKSAALIP